MRLAVATRSPRMLLGRAGERETLDRTLRNVRGGQSAVLVIRGQAGVGKTALLQDVTGQASAFRVAQVAGIEAEVELALRGTAPALRAAADRAGRPVGAAAGRAARGARPLVR